MYAIGEYINGEWRYLASRSTDETFWSTAAVARAMPFPSADAARAWHGGLPSARADALAARFTSIVDLDGGGTEALDDPLDWIDARSFPPSEARLAASDPAVRGKEPRPPKAKAAAAPRLFGGQR